VLQIKEWCRRYAEMRSQREGHSFKLGEGWAVMRNTFVAPSVEEARRDAGEAFLSAHGFVASFHSNKKVTLSFYMDPGEQPATDMELDWDFLVERQLMVGPPENVAEKIHELREVCGVENILANMAGGGGIPQRKVLRSLELFGTKVMPLFKGAEKYSDRVEAARAS